jgi:hypothetical protein
MYRLFVKMFLLVVFAASCGRDHELSTTSADGDMEMAGEESMSDDMDHDDHDMEGMQDSEDDGHAHEHGDEAPTMDWPADLDEPTVTIDASADEAGTIDMTIAVTGFVIVGGDPEQAAPNEGHVHVYVDGHDLGMFFSNDITLENVAAGPHELMVELAAPDHSVFELDGVALRFMTEIVVPGNVVEPDTTFEVHVGEDGAHGGVVEATASIGDVVEIQVVSEIDDDLHVHGYDLYIELVSGETAKLRFEALIPGVFEVELESSGRQVVELTIS